MMNVQFRKQDDELLEELADYAHFAWSGWMEYLFSKSKMNPDGSCTIPTVSVEWWVRQMNTAYVDLSEREKESDRVEAKMILGIVYD